MANEQIEKKTRTSYADQAAATNISEYDVHKIASMVNATKNDQEFADAYPDATFTRTLAYKYKKSEKRSKRASGKK